MTDERVSTVLGIGGIFLDSNDASVLTDWYQHHLGIDFTEHPEGGSYYVVFRSRDLVTGQIRHNPVFAINQTDATLAAPEHKGLTINLRVGDLDEALNRLAAEGVEVDERRVAWEGGKHGWIHDLDGNRIELYQELELPPESPFAMTDQQQQPTNLGPTQ